MASLTAEVAQFGQVVQTSQKEKTDTQASQLELLHSIEHLVRLGPEAEIKTAQAELEKHLTTALLLGPAPPLRHLISSCFVYAYGRGARTNLYSQMGILVSWLNAKSSPASSVASKVAIFELLGELSRAHGGAMVQLCHDAIGVLTKAIRAPELPLRAAACNGLAAALAGSGGVAAQVQQDILKNIKHVTSERGAPAELSQAALLCCTALVSHSDGLWGSDVLEGVLGLCTKVRPQHPHRRGHWHHMPWIYTPVPMRMCMDT